MPKVNKSQYSLDEVYAHYCTTTDKPVSYEMHKKILDSFGLKVVDALVVGKDLKLPLGLATLCVRKKVALTYIDYKESKKQGKRVKASNSKSGFYGAKIMWRRHYTRFNSAGWSFDPSRLLSRSVSKVMSTLNGHQRYFLRAVAGNAEQAKSLYKKKVIGI